ncbi:hypothetical protein KC909_01140 [Candidatus Dojkabacteria bacterium]|uniref:Uncharacterized protein n=1 Tax=Candidatus Dojkabacteria bacterium TaxID=2099670 RepID=A0A955RIJ0_9BACT|nr:hypothetical protein [Candidatus Dojkabacteria bacterium]
MSEIEPNIGPENLIDKTVAYGYDRHGQIITHKSKVLYVKDGLASAGDAYLHAITNAGNLEVLQDTNQIPPFVDQLDFALVQDSEDGNLHFDTPANEEVTLAVTDEDDYEIELEGDAIWPNRNSKDWVRFKVPKGGTVVAFTGIYVSHIADTDRLVVTRLVEDNVDYESGGIFTMEPINTIDEAVNQILADFPWLDEELLYTREGGDVFFNIYIEGAVGDINQHGVGYVDEIRLASIQHRSDRRLRRETEGERYYLACLDFVRLCQLGINMGIPQDEHFQSEIFTLLADLENAAQGNIDLMNRFISEKYPHLPTEERYFKSNRFFTPPEVAETKSGVHSNAHLGMDITIPQGRTEDGAFAALVGVDTHERHHIGSETRLDLSDDDTYEEVLTAEMLTVLTDAIVEGDSGLELDLSIVTSDDYEPGFRSAYFSSVQRILRMVEKVADTPQAYEHLVRSLLFTARTGIFAARPKILQRVPGAVADHGFVISSSRGWYDMPIFDTLARYYNREQLRNMFENEISDRVFRDGRRKKKSPGPRPESAAPTPVEVDEHQLLLDTINTRIQSQFNQP